MSTQADDGSVNYAALAEFRHQIRRFLRTSEEAARSAGLEPQQHQLLLAIKGLPPAEVPTIATLAERLQLKHHTVVELTDRLEAKGLVTRARDPADQRRALLRLTPAGESLLETLSKFHQQELQSLAPHLMSALEAILGAADPPAS